MKLIGKQIVVELPGKLRHISQVPPMDSTMRACGYYEGVNNTLSEVAKMNPALEVDIEGLARTMYEIPGTVPIWEDISYELRCAYIEKAQALASDPSAWLKRKE